MQNGATWRNSWDRGLENVQAGLIALEIEYFTL
jgi:hypothetical protein